MSASQLPTTPVTPEEHSACYRHHRARTVALKLRIDRGLLNGISDPVHEALVEEHQDESECAAYHFCMVRLLGLAPEAVPT